MTDCPFCEIVEGRAPADIVGDFYGVSAFRPLNPVTPGHLLFVPGRHVADAAEDPNLTGQVFATAARWALREGGDFNLITSAGLAATQSIRHLHAHYVPRRSGDGLPLPWTFQQGRL